MSHVREGELHAYLDGALDRLGPEIADRVRLHLTGCEDCQSRIEQERELRELASSLLERALPAEIVAPPFEELLRRSAVGGGSGAAEPSVAATAPPARLRQFSTWKWAWAASLVMALGTGWMMGGGSLDFQSVPAAPSVASRSAASEGMSAATDFAAPARKQPSAVEPRDPITDDFRADREAPRDLGLAELEAPPSAPAQAPAGEPALRRDLRESISTDEAGPIPEELPQNESEESRGAADPGVRLEADRMSASLNEVVTSTGAAASREDADATGSREVRPYARASDGGPVVFEGRPVLAVVEDSPGGPPGILQQLASGDSVLLVWSGDTVAVEQVAILGALVAAPSEGAQVLDGLTSARTRQARELQADVGTSREKRSLGREEPWPTVVRIRRGSALLTVYGTGPEDELRAALLAGGLTPTGA